MSRKRVYISGKISGLDIKVAEGYFESMENQIKEAGHIPINPMKVMAYHPDHTWEDYMIADIRALFGCTAIVMLENWQDSRGAKIEHAIALNNGMEIYYPTMHKYILSKN